MSHCEQSQSTIECNQTLPSQIQISSDGYKKGGEREKDLRKAMETFQKLNATFEPRPVFEDNQ